MEKASPDRTDPTVGFNWPMTTTDSQIWQLPENNSVSQEKKSDYCMDCPVGDLQPLLRGKKSDNLAGERGWSGMRCYAKQANVAFSEGNSLI